MPDETTTPESVPAPEVTPETKELSFTIEKIDENTARKIDKSETVSIINIDILRNHRGELEGEIALKQHALNEINEILAEFDKK